MSSITPQNDIKMMVFKHQLWNKSNDFYTSDVTVRLDSLVHPLVILRVAQQGAVCAPQTPEDASAAEHKSEPKHA